jgi:DNA-binding NtrC family response regulator
LAHILLVEDEPSLQLAMGDTLSDEGFEVTIAGSVRDALRALETGSPDLVLCDLRLPDGEGTEVLASVRQGFPEVPVIVLTAYGTVASAVATIRAGASEYLTKPFENQQLLAMIRRHLELRSLRRRVEELEGLEREPIGSAPAFRRVLELARTVAGSDTTVLILGETGTGKEVLARLIHERSPRRERPFVAVNCAALPEALLESELFGHEKGAFTGAVRQRRGRLEDANGGTLFLDEIAETSPAVQAKLLRALEQLVFERLGSNQQISVDVRILTATRKDLAAEVAAGRFRDDLYYRLKVVPIALPPLRDRAEDIPLLAAAFARRFSAGRSRPLALAPETLECLARHPFPGNVRELQHLVQRLAIVCGHDLVLPNDLPEEYCPQARLSVDRTELSFSGTLAEMTLAFERQVLQQALARFKGHRGQAAEALGISRKNLWEKLKLHGLGE